MDLTAALRAFVRTIETGSMTAAARDLGLSQPAVSKLVRNLENHAGARLLERHSRGLRATEQGSRLYETSGASLAAIDAAFESLRSETGEIAGRLRLQSPVCLGERYLCGIVAAFQQEHPGVRVDLTLENQPADLLHGNLDLALGMGQPANDGTMQRKIGLIRRILVASPDYLAREGEIESCEELSARATVVTDAVLSSQGKLSLTRRGETLEIALDPVLKTNNAHVLVAALRRGQGVGTAQQLLVADDLREGRLVRVLPDYEVAPTALYLTYLPTRHMRPAVRAFADYAVAALQRVEGIFQA